MEFMIFDSTANLVDSFDDRDEAIAALEAIANQDPESADEFAMIAFGDDGLAVGEAITAAHVTASC
jgi:hypothetical protein